MVPVGRNTHKITFRETKTGVKYTQYEYRRKTDTHITTIVILTTNTMILVVKCGDCA
jgi:hypothetical protein